MYAASSLRQKDAKCTAFVARTSACAVFDRVRRGTRVRVGVRLRVWG